MSKKPLNSAEPPAVDGPVPSRMRFEDPIKFLEFYEKQLSRGAVGLRHPQQIQPGTAFLVVISPPGAPDQLRLLGEVTRVRQRSDGAWRLRIELDPRAEDEAWLEGYVSGLRVTIAWQALQPDAAHLPASPLVGPASSAPPARSLSPEALVEASPDEVIALMETLDRLDYYTLLEVPRDVSSDDLQARFHLLTRRFHPDLFHGLDRELVRAVNRVYRRMNEAYSVLKSPMRRKAYDAGLDAPIHSRQLRLGEGALETARRQETTRRGETRPGDFYWKRARAILESARGRKDWLVPALRESARLLRMALYFEPDNTHFRHALEHVEGQITRA